MKTGGVILIIVGIIAMIITGFGFDTQEEVVDLGSVEINKTERHSIGWPPILGGSMVVVGIILLVIGKKK